MNDGVSLRRRRIATPTEDNLVVSVVSVVCVGENAKTIMRTHGDRVWAMEVHLRGSTKRLGTDVADTVGEFGIY